MNLKECELTIKIGLLTKHNMSRAQIFTIPGYFTPPLVATVVTFRMSGHNPKNVLWTNPLDPQCRPRIHI